MVTHAELMTHVELMTHAELMTHVEGGTRRPVSAKAIEL